MVRKQSERLKLMEELKERLKTSLDDLKDYSNFNLDNYKKSLPENIET